MPSHDEIRQELMDAIREEHRNADLLAKVDKELDFLEVTDGINQVNNLDKFYDIFKKRQGQTGHDNKINSWLAYAVGLTSKKPTGEGIPKRRAFARAGFPDIDCDFDYFRRQEIYDYLIGKYGRENVGNIGTLGALKMRSAIRRVGKALDIADSFHLGKQENITENEAKVTEIVKSLPYQYGAQLKVKDKSGEEHVIKSCKDAYKYCKDFKYYIDKYSEKDYYKHLSEIEGLIVSFGIHAAGIVLSNTPLRKIAPLRSSNKGLATQYPWEDLENIGLIKFDILAISTLTVIRETLKLVKDHYGIDIDIENLALDDDTTYKLYQSGNLTGVFQCENEGMQETIKSMEASCFDDIVASVALYRPGPMESIPDYCERKKGLREVDYFHPALEKYVKPYLQNTYGFIVYQEQIMQICNSLAGLSVTDGYVLIKGIGKKKEKLIEKYRKLFVEGAAKNGLPQKLAEKYWQDYIKPFALYGFNKAHACSYGFLSYVTAYLKANYTDEFFCAYLNIENYRKKQDKVEELEKDCAKFDIEILPRNINNCKVEYEIVKRKDDTIGIPKTLISPSLICKGLGYETAQEIERNQPYENLRDLAIKTSTKLVDQDAIGGLVDAGFYDKEFAKVNRGKTGKARITKDKFRELITNKFSALRKDIKNSRNKGLGPETLF